MSYKEKPQIKLYSYINSSFVRMYIVDDYQSCSWERKKYEAGQFTIQINYNLPNSQLFKKGMFVQFGNDSKDFGIIQSVNDAVGANGKASQMRTITGYDCRYLYKRRIIRSLNSTDAWTMTASGELCMRNLIADQCGENADEKRKLPIANTIPEEGIGSEYTVSEAYSNLYDVLVTIATQSDVMWFVEFSEGALSLNFYEGNDLTATVRLDTDYESLQNGNYTDSFDSFSNAVYVGGQGSGSGREIYEGEDADDEGNSPSGFDRFESWDDASTLTDSEEYETEAKSVLNEYAQTLTLTGAGLAKSPYVYKEQYDVGDTVKVKFNDIESSVQIQSVTEAWSKGNYSLAFEFGKPIKSLSRQLSLLLKKIQNYSATSGTTTVTSVKYYDVSTETEMASDEVTYDTIGFTGTISTDKTFTLYLNGKTGAKNYMVYVKNLSGGNVTLTTGVENASTVTLKEGTYCVEVYVDEEGNITSGTLIADTVESGNDNAVSSSAVYESINDECKNLITFPYFRDSGYTTNGVVFTYNEEGIITATGTATANAFFTLFNYYDGYKNLKVNTKYKLSIENQSSNVLTLYIYDTTSGSTWTTITINSSGYHEIEFTTPADVETTWQITLRVGQGVTVDDELKIMLRDASITDTTYQPYTMTNRELTENLIFATEDVPTVSVANSSYTLTEFSSCRIGKICQVHALITIPANTIKTDGSYTTIGTITPAPKQMLELPTDYKTNHTYLRFIIRTSGEIQIYSRTTNPVEYYMRFGIAYITN